MLRSTMNSTLRFIRPVSRSLSLTLALLAGCAAGGSTSGGPSSRAPESSPLSAPGTTAAPASQAAATSGASLTALSASETSARVRVTRTACSAEATKGKYEVVDFVTFDRLDEVNWDATIRARKAGRLLRIGCRYDTAARLAYVYEPSSADGGNPWGRAGRPAGTPAPAPSVGAPASSPASSSPPAAVPKPAPPAAPGAGIDLALISDTTARSAIARTRDACIAEAKRRKITFADFDAFRRVDGTRWEALLLLRTNAKATRSCQLDLASGKATIK